MKVYQEVFIIWYCCPHQDCSKKYKSKFNLRKHVESSHLGKKFFICSDCGKSFASNHTLKEHTNKHKNIKPYKCTECGENFRHYSYLSLHRRAHQPEYQMFVFEEEA